jgi:AcrR family transcriptional regulator
VAEVARAANVSVNTVFNYFPTKEDLLFDRQDEVVRRLARAVHDRAADESPAAAVCRAFLGRLDRDDPTLGLRPGAERFWRIVDESPALLARVRLLRELTEDALAEALPSGSRLAAAVIAAADHALHAEIRRRVTRGEPAPAIRAAIRAGAERAFSVIDALA